MSRLPPDHPDRLQAQAEDEAEHQAELRRIDREADDTTPIPEWAWEEKARELLVPDDPDRTRKRVARALAEVGAERDSYRIKFFNAGVAQKAAEAERDEARAEVERLRRGYCAQPTNRTFDRAMAIVDDYYAGHAAADASERKSLACHLEKSMIEDQAALRAHAERLAEALREDASDARKLLGAMAIGGWNPHAAAELIGDMERRARAALAAWEKGEGR